MADQLNGSFEVAGSVFVLLNVLQLYRDKQVRGVSPIAVGFFTVWGHWNLYYYPSLSQTWSALGAGSKALVNTVYLVMMIYYIRRERKCEQLRLPKSLLWTRGVICAGFRRLQRLLANTRS